MHALSLAHGELVETNTVYSTSICGKQVQAVFHCGKGVDKLAAQNSNVRMVVAK